MDKQYFHQVIRLLLVLFIAISIYFTVKYFLLFFYPFAIAGILAYIINPTVTFLESRLNTSRFLATVTVAVTFFVGNIIIFTYIIAELFHGTLYLAKVMPPYLHRFMDVLIAFSREKVLPIYHKLNAFIQSFNHSQQLKIHESIEEVLHQFTLVGIDVLQSLLLKIPSILSMFPYSFTVTIVIFIATFLITKDWNYLQTYFKKHVPDPITTTTIKVKNNLKRSFFGYIKAQFTLIFLTAMIIFIGLSFLKINHSLTITIIIAFLDFIPILGVGTVFIPWIFYLFFIQAFPSTIGISLLYIIVICFRQFVEPKILADHVGLNPLLALMILFFSIQFWGVSGFLLSPILFICFSAFYQSNISETIYSFVKG